MYNPMSLHGKRLLVTGASSGIGRSCSIAFSKLGARLVLVARNEDRLMGTLKSLDGQGHAIFTFDFEDVEAIPAWMKMVSSGNPLDGLLHCAGIFSSAPLKIVKMDQHEKLIRVNVSSALSLAIGFRQRGVCTNPSSLVYISSIAGLVGQPALSSYSSSKAALIGLTRALAIELAREGIRVNCISPGLVESEMSEVVYDKMTPEQVAAISHDYPLGLGRPEDVANAAAFLLSEAGRWITGTNLIVDGGRTAH